MKRLIAALLLTATPVMAFDIQAMSDTEKAAFGEAVREYLMANPEVLIELINVLEERRAANRSRMTASLSPPTARRSSTTATAGSAATRMAI